MKTILLFIDGTICDTRSRIQFINTPEFYQRDRMLSDQAVPGSVSCLNGLSQRYEIVYIGARPNATRSYTMEWLIKKGVSKGVYLSC
jgi:uncharacterized HAD superfamily protein